VHNLDSAGFTKVGAIGYCYGGGPVFALAKKPDIIDTFVVAHTKVTVPADITTNAKPGLILAADVDFTFNEKAREEAAGIIEKEGLQEKVQMKVYPGTFHGFAIRGDDRVEAVKKAKEEAFYDATKWFKKHLV
jgi:carboxymethylenebutenolidase